MIGRFSLARNGESIDWSGKSASQSRGKKARVSHAAKKRTWSDSKNRSLAFGSSLNCSLPCNSTKATPNGDQGLNL